MNFDYLSDRCAFAQVICQKYGNAKDFNSEAELHSILRCYLAVWQKLVNNSRWLSAPRGMRVNF